MLEEGTHHTAARKPGELTFSIILLAFSITALYFSTQISGVSSISAPGTLPIIASVILLLSSLINTRQIWTLPVDPETNFFSLLTPLILLNFLLLGLSYVVLLNWFGFLIASFLYLFTSILYLHRRGWLLAFFVSLNSLAIIYVVFRLIFKVILPEGVFAI